MTEIDDCINHLDSNWQTGVTSKPSFFNGHKQVVEGTNYIHVFNQTSDFMDYDAAGIYQDEKYFMMLRVGSKETQNKRDLMLQETKRIFNDVTISGYHYNRVTRHKHRASSQDWETEVYLELIKLLRNK